MNLDLKETKKKPSGYFFPLERDNSENRSLDTCEKTAAGGQMATTTTTHRLVL
jgi:hypothetical protein